MWNRLMVPLSMPISFHMYTPSATPMPKMPFLQQQQQQQQQQQHISMVVLSM
jgi:hypothetical protein